MIRIGCCGFPVGMKRYVKDFEVVEVQKTFYRPPDPETAKRWRIIAGENFEFVIKAWQLITHPPSSPTYRKAGIELSGDSGFFKPNKNVEIAWEKTEEIASILRCRIILFQTPRSFKETEENIENMRSFFSQLERNYLFAWEPRGWRKETVRWVCEEIELIHVCDPFAELPVTDGDVVYLRLHGSPPGEKMYRYTYTERDLDYLADLIKKFEGDVYCLFNNVSMFRDALKLKQLLGKSD